MSKFALPATLLIRVDAHAGEWVPLATLAAFVALPVATVTACLDELVRQGQLHFGQRDGRLFYGVQVEGVPLPPAGDGFTDPDHPPAPVRQHDLKEVQ